MQFLAAWMEAERGRFILWLPVAMGAAILIYFNLSTEPPLWLGLLLSGLAFTTLAAAWRHPPARFIAALSFAAALGFARAEWRTAAEPPLITIPYGAVAITGTIATIDPFPNGRRLTLNPVALNATPTPRAIRVKLRLTDSTPLTPGEQISLRALLFKPDRPAYPGAWDSGRDAFFQGLGASGFAIGDVTLTATPKTNGITIWLRGLREAIATQIMAVLPLNTGSVAVTLLTGFQQQMPAAERQNFIAAGLAHILAVAGLHVGIVMGLFFGTTRYLLTRHPRPALHLPNKAIAAIVALLAGGAYAALTGGHLPILRSLAMASLVTLGVLAGRRAISLRGLALAALALMLLTPEVIIGVSFQMSFSAVLALISGYAAVNFWFARLYAKNTHAHRGAAHIAALFYTSLLAGGASMPFAAFQFQQIQPYWILANLAAVPLTALWVLPLGLISLALMPLGLAYLALIPMGWGISIIVWLTTIIAAWPGAMLRIEPMPTPAILLISFGLAWLCLWRSTPRLAGIAFILAGGLVYAAARPPDILISPDAKLIAVFAPPEILLFRQPKATAFTLTQWQPVWGGAPFTPFNTATCANNFCQPATQADTIIAEPPTQTPCPTASLIISPEPLHGACNAPGRTIIDRFTVWHDGAIAIWRTPTGLRILTGRQTQGTRPWVTPWPQWRYSSAAQ
jgi:competence protein ComEC